MPRFKFALRGAFARQIERKLIKRDETLTTIALDIMGQALCGFVFKIAISGLKKDSFRNLVQTPRVLE